MAKIHKFLVKGQPIRAAVIVCPEVIDELCVALRASPLATMAAGRVAIAAGLLASQMKDTQVALRFSGDGPLGDVYAEANYHGRMRAHALHAQAPLLMHAGEIDVTAGIGAGVLEVTSSHPGLEEAQVSTVALGGNGIADDIAHYLHQSQQVLSVVAIGMGLNPEGRVEAAGGILIEVMQDASEAVLSQLEENVKSIGALSEHLLEGISAEGIAELYLQGFEIAAMQHPSSLYYQCLCSHARVLRAFTLLGKSELLDIQAEACARKVTCEFCHKEYEVALADIGELIKNIAAE